MADKADSRLDLWIEERHQNHLGMRFRVGRTLFSGASRYQTVDIVETAGYGRMLLNDGLVMISERDEFVYHEMISHVPLFVHRRPRRVLVIGGGDGGTVREILRHPAVERCRLVEIDRMVVDACREHLPQTASALDDPRCEVTIADGVRFVAETDERFDLVLVDSTDPIGPAEPLFGPGFYADVFRLLDDDGIVVSQAESPFYEIDRQRSMIEILARIFRRVQIYNYVNLTYPGALWSFIWATKGDLCPVGALDPGRIADAGLEFSYYSAEVHRAAFVHPAFQARALSDLLTPLDRFTD